MSTTALQSHILGAIQKAECDGFHYFADALRLLYANRFGQPAPMTLRRLSRDTLAAAQSKELSPYGN